MHHYFFFNISQENLILQFLADLSQPLPFFDFKSKLKLVQLSQIPNSNTDSKTLSINRCVFGLEIGNIDNQELLQVLKDNSEYWWLADQETANRSFWFLSQTDALTVGKTKEELDILYEQSKIN